MLDKIEIMRMAHALSQHASSRQQVVARNVANADTPGYRAQALEPFAESYRQADGMELRATRPGHIGAEAPVRLASAAHTFETSDPVSPNGNTVSLETEMTKSAEIKLQHDMATSIYKTSLDILRASIGRGR